ncbi:MAG: SIS domain-containing protein [Devosia sp.]|uniref:SIS domain-containing protein n=1 Tax=Devosia sp. TaxID=1871048 RepID=UPI001AD489C1|nr:SIS domain-containing protein [Devosia sp.]MBN9315382.1 SIS domain-containing protein [Devosia sp.]
MTAPVRRRYRDKLVEILDRVLDTQPEALDAARDAVAAALASDHLVYVAGSGHSHLLAEEVFYRAGGIAAAQAILDPDLMLHLGAERSTLLEREEGRAERALADYPVGPGDVVFIASNSGRNAYPIEMALAAKARGALTIAITSMRHATAITSRHGSGKLLYQVTDLVLDNGGEYGDAALIVGHDRRMGPTSTIAGVFILNAVLAEAVDKLAGIGVDVDVYQSANMQGAEAAAQEMIRRWQARIRGL